MNLTNIECFSNTCHGKHVIMGGAGGQVGGRITLGKLRCPECGFTVMIIPMQKQYEYIISAKTEEEIKQERIDKLREEAQLELARRINQIKGI